MIAVDTNILIYFLEKNPRYYDQCEAILMPIFEQKDYLVLSSIVIAELTSSNSVDMTFFELPNIRIVAVTEEIAFNSGNLRRTQKLSLPDAIHISTALSVNASTFYTNDQQLLKLGRINKLKIVGLK